MHLKNLAPPRILIALSPCRPDRGGKLGWGYEDLAGRWRVGSYEASDWLRPWSCQACSIEEALAILAAMKNFDADYAWVKLLSVPPDWPLGSLSRDALTPESAMERCPEWVFQAFSVLDDFAPGLLPRPEDGSSPNAWYYQIQADEELDLACLAPYLPKVVIPAGLISAAPDKLNPPNRFKPGL